MKATASGIEGIWSNFYMESTIKSIIGNSMRHSLPAFHCLPADPLQGVPSSTLSNTNVAMTVTTAMVQIIITVLLSDNWQWYLMLLYPRTAKNSINYHITSLIIHLKLLDLSNWLRLWTTALSNREWNVQKMYVWDPEKIANRRP